MGPKKQVEEKKILLGRPGNNLKSGIVSEIFISLPAASKQSLISLLELLGRSCQRW